MYNHRTIQLWSRRVHIYVSMALLLVVLFFTLTGITLNHPDVFVKNNPNVSEEVIKLPKELLASNEAMRTNKTQLINFLREHSSLKGFPSEIDLYTEVENGEISFGEMTLSFSAPGYRSSVYIDLVTHQATIEHSDYGLVALLNDAHKGRHCGPIWQAFIDVTAVLMSLFIITGLMLILPKRKTLNLSTKWMAVGSLATGLIFWISIP